MRTDIFGLAPRQQDMFGAPQESFDTPMTVEEIRTELEETIDLLRKSDVLPWSTQLMLRVDTMFPVIAAKLPANEAVKLVASFQTEMYRLRNRAA